MTEKQGIDDSLAPQINRLICEHKDKYIIMKETITFSNSVRVDKITNEEINVVAVDPYSSMVVFVITDIDSDDESIDEGSGHQLLKIGFNRNSNFHHASINGWSLVKNSPDSVSVVARFLHQFSLDGENLEKFNSDLDIIINAKRITDNIVNNIEKIYEYFLQGEKNELLNVVFDW